MEKHVASAYGMMCVMHTHIRVTHLNLAQASDMAGSRLIGFLLVQVA